MKSIIYSPVLDSHNILTRDIWMVSVVIEPQALEREHIFVLIEGIECQKKGYKAIMRKYELYPKATEEHEWGDIVIEEFSANLDDIEQCFENNIGKSRILKYKSFEVTAEHADIIHKRIMHRKENPKKNYSFID